jgi:hypothetical protein
VELERRRSMAELKRGAEEVAVLDDVMVGAMDGSGVGDADGATRASDGELQRDEAEGGGGGGGGVSADGVMGPFEGGFERDEAEDGDAGDGENAKGAMGASGSGVVEGEADGGDAGEAVEASGMGVEQVEAAENVGGGGESADFVKPAVQSLGGEVEAEAFRKAFYAFLEQRSLPFKEPRISAVRRDIFFMS